LHIILFPHLHNEVNLYMFLFNTLALKLFLSLYNPQ
jgi:hypothetical protein